MVLEHYISDLLYRYNCVAVPNFGAFLTQKRNAKLVEESNTFYPPAKEISFNRQLTTNDGLLVSYIAEAEKSTYEAILTKIEAAVTDWTEELTNNKTLFLENIGELTLNAEEKIIFKPLEKVNYLTSSFGLTSFNSAAVTREVLKEEVAQLEETIPFIITPEKRETTSFRPYLKYAAIFLLALSTGLTVYRGYKQSETTKQLVQQEAQNRVSKHIQEATFFESSPLELPSITLDATTAIKNVIHDDLDKNQTVHYIVAGAFRYKTNAEKKIRQLKRRGYNASYFGTNAHGLHMVSYDHFTDTEKALETLKQVKHNHSKDAWLFSAR
ncbi:sporulation related protein [Maribacter vaceletii]|uniref:Sporulation related protein n=1 Tax=Maribacter vaceletii TaxID=1206816 RepID=A0A495EDL6_9FLAO|nr:SPOR domain-containing protein [Maribacter vaceletii]RKR14731.1 sporulation related protein [Maribacter vaceletii]